MSQLECAVCKEHAESRCGGCNTVYYCSQVCQRADWKSHKPICAEKKKSIEKCDKRTDDVLNDIYVHIKSCSNCSCSLPTNACGSRTMILCQFCKMDGYCSDACFRLDAEKHKKKCDHKKFQVVLSWKLAKDFYLSKSGTRDPEVIEAIDTIIANLKVSERYSDNVLGKTIMSEYMAYIEANPARKSADRLTFTRLNKDYMAGRLKLEDVV